MARTKKAPAPWIARQGDVMIQRVASIPADATPRAREQGRVILAAGEVTGHHHAIADTLDAPAAQLLDLDGLTFLRVDMGTQVVHEEHSAIPLAPGNYRVVRQREYQAPEITRNVAD